MEEMNENMEIQEPQGYKSRPKWQIVLAWIGVVIMIIAVIMTYYHIASGGLL